MVNILEIEEGTACKSKAIGRCGKNVNGSERAKSLVQGNVLRSKTNHVRLAQKGRNQDIALTWLSEKRAKIDRAMSYPIDYATLWWKNKEKPKICKSVGKFLVFRKMFCLLFAIFIVSSSFAQQFTDRKSVV